MDCADIRDIFLAGGFPSGPEVEEHLRFCPHCRELLEADDALGARLAAGQSQAEPGAELLRAVEAEIARERGLRAWLRSRATPLRWLFVVGSVLVVVGFHQLLRRRTDFDFYPLARFQVVSALFGVALMLGVDGALRVLTRAQPRRLLLAGAALSVFVLPFLVALLPPPAADVHPAALAGAGADFAARALGCFVYGVLISLPAAALLWLTSRDDRPNASTLLFAAGSAGVAANLALHAHCAITYPGHLLAGHATVGVCWLVLGALGARLARAR